MHVRRDSALQVIDLSFRDHTSHVVCASMSACMCDATQLCMFLNPGGPPRDVGRAAAATPMEAPGRAAWSGMDEGQCWALGGGSRGDPGLRAQAAARGGGGRTGGGVCGFRSAGGVPQSEVPTAFCGCGHAEIPPSDHDTSLLRPTEALVHVRWSADGGALLYVFTPPPTFLMPSLCDAPRHAPQNNHMLWDCTGALAIFSCFSDPCLIRSLFPFL